jgi:hypothetical protein
MFLLVEYPSRRPTNWTTVAYDDWHKCCPINTTNTMIQQASCRPINHRMHSECCKNLSWPRRRGRMTKQWSVATGKAVLWRVFGCWVSVYATSYQSSQRLAFTFHTQRPIILCHTWLHSSLRDTQAGCVNNTTDLCHAPLTSLRHQNVTSRCWQKNTPPPLK